MKNIAVSPLLPGGPAATGPGPWVDVSSLGREKTVTVSGAFTGALNIEVGNNSAGNNNWSTLHTFTGPGQKTFDVACEAMRTRLNTTINTGSTDPPTSPTVDVAADDDGVQVANLPVSAGDGNGAGVDVELLGTFKTIIVAGAWTGTVTIQVSHDGSNWTPVHSFTKSYTMFSDDIAALYLRVVRSGGSTGTPVVYVAAVNDDERLAELFGDGSDGDVVLGAPLTLTRDMYYRTLNTNEHLVDLAGFRMFVSEILEVDFPGNITANGAAGAAEVGGAAAVGVTVGAGAAGGNGNAGAAGSAGSAIAGQGLGEGGGTGGTGNGGANAGGVGGAVTALDTATETQPRAVPECFTGRTWAGATPALIQGGAGGGGGGGDAAANEGGGGGGGGGVAIISAKTIRGSGRIQANGGAGAAGTAADAGGGGGGGGGVVILNYRLLLLAQTNVQADGGAGGASGGGTGVAGAVGTDGTIILNEL